MEKSDKKDRGIARRIKNLQLKQGENSPEISILKQEFEVFIADYKKDIKDIKKSISDIKKVESK